MDEETVSTLAVTAELIVIMALVRSGRGVVILVTLWWLNTVYHRIKRRLSVKAAPPE